MTVAIWVMGFSGIVAQVLLLRELLIVFSGNELSIGIVLANWLVLEAAGSFLLGKKIESLRRKLEAYVLVQTMFSFALPLAVYGVRSLRGAIGVVSGEGFGLPVIFLSSFLLLLPVSLPHGALFTFGCRLYAEVHGRPSSWAVGRVYLYETLGTIVGGTVFVYLMLPYLHSVRIALIVSLLNLAICLVLLKPFRQRRILAGASAAASVAVAFLLLGRGADQVHRLSVERQWQGQKVVYYGNSIYGNVVVVEDEGQYTFFSNGIPVVAAPVPDIAFVEEFVHIPMLSHPEPEEVLILSGGVGGVIREVLKHPTVKRIDYAELDPMLLEVLRRFTDPSELDDPRVHVHNTDGRLFVRMSPRRYDIIFVGLRDPSNLQVNRLFTEEFFLLAKGKLGRGGILVLCLPGSLTYISEELRDLNACILRTLEAVYPHIRIIPGDLNLYLASSSPEVSRITPSLLAERMRERSLEVSLLTPGYLRYRLHRRWLDWFSASLKGAREGNNEDFAPLAVFRSLWYWNAIFAPSLRGWFGRLEGIGLGHIFSFLLVLTFTLAFLLCLGRSSGVPFAVASTGFAGMLYDLMLVFAFQVLYGYVFHQIGILITALMSGMAAGSLFMASFSERVRRDLLCFAEIELAMIVFSISLPGTFLLLRSNPEGALIRWIFPVLSFISGFPVGAQFPLAARICLKSSPKLGTTAGMLYACDLMGGWVGGLVGGVFLLPVLGLTKTCWTLAALKLSSLVVFFASSWKLT